MKEHAFAIVAMAIILAFVVLIAIFYPDAAVQDVAPGVNRIPVNGGWLYTTEKGTAFVPSKQEGGK